MSMLLKNTELNRWRLTAIRSSPGAFTSIELLVVIAVLALLAAILLPALARVKEKEIRVICVKNEKQLYTSLHIYWDDNGEKLPDPNAGGNWPWDVSASTTTVMLNNGCTKKTFYCPSTAPRFTDQQNWEAANSLWNFGGSHFNITGYSFTFGASASRLDPQYQNLSLLTESHTSTSSPQIFFDSPGTRELIADVILSTGNTLPAASRDDFTTIFGGFTQNGSAYPHLSAHLGRDPVPAGGNIAYKDGHVQWKKFDASSPSTVTNNTKVRTGFNNPYFWW